MWDVFGNNQNYNVLSGHKNAILELKWKTDNTLLTCSADKTVALWDSNRALRLRRFTEHTAIVNSCSACLGDMNLAASGSDDCTAIIWDSRTKESVMTAYHDYQVCAVQLSHDGQFLYTAGVDSIVRRFDLRVGMDKADLQLDGHAEIITGLALSPDGSSLLSNSMDCTLRLYDVRAYTNQRQRALLLGGHHGAEKLLLRCAWSADGEYVTAGSADRLVHMWETSRYTEMCAWGGHKASVNEVVFHPTQPVLASASSDKTVMLGEFLPQ
ncbi:WD40 repeat domain-containing protein [archaeon]|nr:MAG: WD40 repeat domain-containing protein [archaeon]